MTKKTDTINKKVEILKIITLFRTHNNCCKLNCLKLVKEDKEDKNRMRYKSNCSCRSQDSDRKELLASTHRCAQLSDETFPPNQLHAATIKIAIPHWIAIFKHTFEWPFPIKIMLTLTKSLGPLSCGSCTLAEVKHMSVLVLKDLVKTQWNLSSWTTPLSEPPVINGPVHLKLLVDHWLNANPQTWTGPLFRVRPSVVHFNRFHCIHKWIKHYFFRIRWLQGMNSTEIIFYFGRLFDAKWKIFLIILVEGKRQGKNEVINNHWKYYARLVSWGGNFVRVATNSVIVWGWEVTIGHTSSLAHAALPPIPTRLFVADEQIELCFEMTRVAPRIVFNCDRLEWFRLWSKSNRLGFLIWLFDSDGDGDGDARLFSELNIVVKGLWNLV